MNQVLNHSFDIQPGHQINRKTLIRRWLTEALVVTEARGVGEIDLSLAQ
jgi:hypothetical protein